MFYALALAAGFSAGLPVDLAGVCSDARSARFLSRFAACDRLRVFSRALSFGIGETPLRPADQIVESVLSYLVAGANAQVLIGQRSS
jgi:hypothetical protein